MVSISQNSNETPQNAPLVPPKMEFFNFGLEQKLDQHSCVEFHGNSDGNGFKAQKLIIDLLIVLTCIQSNQL